MEHYQVVYLAGRDGAWVEQEFYAASSWGWGVVAVLLLGGAAYLGGGIAYGSRRQGRATTGLRAHPHYRQMVALHALVLDGVAVVRGTKKAPARGYVEAPDGRRGKQELKQQAPDRATGRHSAKEKKEKKEKKERKERKKDKEKRGPTSTTRDNDDGDGGGSLVEPVGTAAGGGACSRPSSSICRAVCLAAERGVLLQAGAGCTCLPSRY